MGKINKMSLHLANMIAAGEVVERPSSVVKELVENAIDAESKNIKIYLENGGLDLIKVVDDGCGMDSDDVVMAFLPHATSKIKTEYDLFRISTLGFRGEAIASIASVSNMQIISSLDGITGYECTYKSGVKQSEGIIHSNKGTTVSVSGLFFNTPARLKYMKSAKNELASIMFFIDRIALSHPDLRFSVISDGKIVFQTSGSNDYKTLFGEIYGVDAAKNVIEHVYVVDGYKAHLVFVKPSVYRANKLEITMICNGRYVKNYNITNAVIDGFQTYLPIGKYPIGVLYFDIDTTLVDVNVHPRKTEIKIADEEIICEKLTKEIKSMLTSATHIPTRIVSEEVKKEVYVKSTIFEMPNFFEEETVEYISDFTQTISKKEDVSVNEIIENNPQTTEDVVEILDDKIEDTKIVEDKLPYLEYVGTIFGTYLIYQNDKGMYLIDQHAAQERINYEKYYEILANPNQPRCGLLIPVMLSFTKQESLYIEQNIDRFKEIGFTLEQIGANDYVLREAPLWVDFDNTEDIIYEILSLMISNKKIEIMHFRDAICKQISCKASIRANHRINELEREALINQLRKCKNPYTCPHGRPSIIKLSVSDIEKMFERIQK